MGAHNYDTTDGVYSMEIYFRCNLKNNDLPCFSLTIFLCPAKVKISSSSSAGLRKIQLYNVKGTLLLEIFTNKNGNTVS